MKFVSLLGSLWLLSTSQLHVEASKGKGKKKKSKRKQVIQGQGSEDSSPYNDDIYEGSGDYDPEGERDNVVDSELDDTLHSSESPALGRSYAPAFSPPPTLTPTSASPTLAPSYSPTISTAFAATLSASVRHTSTVPSVSPILSSNPTSSSSESSSTVTSLEASMETSLEASTEATIEASTEVSIEASIAPSMQSSTGVSLEASSAPAPSTKVVESCEGLCQGSFPFGCATFLHGVTSYRCNPHGGCFYSNSTEEASPSEDFCTYQVVTHEENQECADVCPGDFPYGCATELQDISSYRCSSSGSCFYAPSELHPSPNDSFCEYKKMKSTSSPPLSPSPTGSVTLPPTALEAVSDAHQDCSTRCQGTYPYGCATDLEGVTSYHCNAIGGCWYSQSSTNTPNADVFCTFKLSPTLSSSPTSSPFLAAVTSPTLSDRIDRSPSPMSLPSLPVPTNTKGPVDTVMSTTSFPTLKPSLPKCEVAEDGNFGSTTSDQLTVTLMFGYELETFQSVNVENAIPNLEHAFTTEILPILFPEVCGNATRRWLHERRLNVVAISSEPTDEITSAICSPTVNPSYTCTVVLGQLSLSMVQASSEELRSIRDALRDAMDSGTFIDNEGGIVRVSYVQLDNTIDQSQGSDGQGPNQIGSTKGDDRALRWGLSISAVFAVCVIFVATAYKRKREVRSHDASTFNGMSVDGVSVLASRNSQINRPKNHKRLVVGGSSPEREDEDLFEVIDLGFDDANEATSQSLSLSD